MRSSKVFSVITLISLTGYMNACNDDPSFVSREHELGSRNGSIDDDTRNGDSTKDPASGSTDPKPGDKGGGGEQTVNWVQASQSFAAAETSSGSLDFSLDNAYVEQSLELIRSYSNRSGSYQQGSRPTTLDTFHQGYSPTKNTESFLQTENRLVDIAIVIDNSASMAEEQVNLSQKLDPLLSMIAHTDWQIGVVTTDPSAGCLRSLIKKGDSNISSKFASAIQAGINGTGYEQGVYQATQTLRGSCLSKPWIRANSTVSVLIVSDEDNCSNGTECGNVSHASGDYLYNYLGSIRDIGKNAFVNGLIYHPSQNAASCPTGYYKAPIYADLIERTSGAWGSICAADYSDTLRSISTNIAVNLAKTFTLNSQPNNNSTKVYLNNVELGPNQFTVNKQTVELTSAPPANAIIKIEYLSGGEEILNSFQLSSLAYQPHGFSVSVNGTSWPASKYQFDANSNRINFLETPPERATISIGYKKNTALNTDFLIGVGAKVDSIQVKVNGVATTAFSYVPLVGLLRFDVAPPENATINYVYTISGNPVLNYPFSVAGLTGGLTIKDAYTGTTIPATYANSIITFPAAHWQEGRLVKISYLNPSRDDFTIQLPQVPFEDRVQLVAGATSCSSGATIQVNGKNVTYKNCHLPTNVSVATIYYEYLTSVKQVYELSNVQLPPPEVEQIWTVKVDNVPTTEYTRDGATITLAQPPPPISIVHLEVKYKKGIIGK